MIKATVVSAWADNFDLKVSLPVVYFSPACQSRETRGSRKPVSVHYISSFHQTVQPVLYFFLSENPSGISPMGFEKILKSHYLKINRGDSSSPVWKQHLVVFASNFRPLEEDNYHSDYILMCRATCWCQFKAKMYLKIQPCLCLDGAFLF